MSNKISDLGMNIKKFRELRGFSGKQLSEKASIGRSTLSEIETGKSQSLSSVNIEKIAKALDISTDCLLQSNDISTVGKNINNIRIKKRLSIDDLAGMSGVSHNTLSKIETGILQKLNPTILNKISSALSVSPGTLLGTMDKSVNISEYIKSLDIYKEVYIGDTLINKEELTQLATIINSFKAVIDMNRKMSEPDATVEKEYEKI